MRKTVRQDHYQEVTDKIVAALEQGILPWRRPWNPELAGVNQVPRNAVTGRRYRGINVLVLGLSPLAWQSGEHRWSTYRQAAERGWHVRKGERGTTVVFFKTLTVREQGRDIGETQDRVIPLLRLHSVFHASQIEGVPELSRPDLKPVAWRCPEAVDVIVRASGAAVRYGGPSAFYSPGSDHIQMPPLAAFHSQIGFAATLLHELAHWSSGETRLNRVLGGRFGSRSYAEEELRAEVCSAMLGAELGLPLDLRSHANYLGDWIKTLRGDRKAIFRAAADAQKIADYLLSFHPQYRDGEPDADLAEDSGASGREAA